MLGITSFSFFIIAVLLLNATPGPDTAFIVGRSVSQGRKAGIVSALGISVGCIVHSLAVSFGLTAILAASATAFTFIKIAGAIYLIYLGARMLFARKNDSSAEEAATLRGVNADTTTAANLAQKPAKSLGSVFISGFWTNVLNPKVILFFVSFFPQFVSTSSMHKTLAFLTLGAVFVVMSTVWNCGVAWVAGSVTQRMRGKPAVRRWIDRVVGTAFIGLGVRLAALHR